VRRTWNFLFASDDLPVGLQVFWKLLTLGGTAMLVYAAVYETPQLAGKVFLLFLAAGWLFMALFTKLGDG
jgi:hypothetical protein